MAKRYRYAFIKKKEAWRGKVSVALAIASVALFVAAMVCEVVEVAVPHLTGTLCLLGTLFSAYGFLEGLISFREKNREHFTSIVGSIACGIIFIVWLGLYFWGA